MSKPALDAYWTPFNANRQFKAAPRMVLSAQGMSHRTPGGPPHLAEPMHGYTCSGHLLACAAALAMIDVLHDEELPGSPGRRGARHWRRRSSADGLHGPKRHARARPLVISTHADIDRRVDLLRSAEQDNFSTLRDST
jgi:adenosylmethionine-8-amino-7-oxononanoate aminotransferase